MLLGEWADWTNASPYGHLSDSYADCQLGRSSEGNLASGTGRLRVEAVLVDTLIGCKMRMEK